RNRHAAEQLGIEVEVRPVDSNLVMAGDRRQLVSAVSNLVHNGVKFSELGGNVELGARAVDDHIEIEIVDRGIGIPAAAIERIFERFYRVDLARSRNTGGT